MSATTPSMLRNVGQATQTGADAGEIPTDGFRGNIAMRAPEHHAEFPRSTELEARCLEAMAPELHGNATYCRGIRSAQGMRAALAGQRHFHLSDLCRLATTPGREPRAAVLAVVTELAASIGFRLEPTRPGGPDLLGELGESIVATADLHAEFARAAGDGVIDADEALRLRPKFEAAKRELAEMESTLSGAPRR